MATLTGGSPEDVRRAAVTPRPKGRENAKDTLCRNVTIYGHCRYEDKGCVFNHDPIKVAAPQNPPESLKKHLNVDSPSFTPSSLAVNGTTPSKSSGLSPKAASAAPFKPKGLASATANTFTPSLKQYNPTAPGWVAPEVHEFLPQSYNTISAAEPHNGTSQADPFDPYPTVSASIVSASHTPQPQTNPYVQDPGSLGVAAFYQGSGNFSQPLQHHLYAALGPHREPPQSNQRFARDLFIPEDLRQMLQKKTEASLATFPNSTLPPNIAHFQALVPLVHNTQKNTNLFGYSSWIYKAISSHDGKAYCLRRLQGEILGYSSRTVYCIWNGQRLIFTGYRLTNDATNEKAIRSIQQNWKRVRNGNVVTVFLAFTNSGFGDSSLIFVTDYHPLSETLAQRHFTPVMRFSHRQNSIHVAEQILWGYIVQIANALKAIHSAGLAARVIDSSKVILTSENRIRLNACAIMDVVQHDTSLSLAELQRQDLFQFGRLILALGTNNIQSTQSRTKAIELFGRTYTPHLRETVSWLLDSTSPEKTADINVFLSHIASDVINVFDSSLHLDDQLNTDLTRELENSRIVRLLTKLNFINERPEYEHDRQWAEQGTRYILLLFRDYVFHQVDGQGNPVLDLAHVLACLNKLDAGIDEKITLTARDENTVAVVSYRELKSAVEAAWGDLMRRAA